MKPVTETRLRVRYAETDQMGIVYYGNYLTWFEIGRVELCRQLGFEYKRMEIDDDSFIIVAEARCRYKKPARFDDVLLIRTRVTQSQRRTLRFGYEILRQDSGWPIHGSGWHTGRDWLADPFMSFVVYCGQAWC